jgi:hypothetical protein
MPGKRKSAFLVSARPFIRYRDLTGLMQADRARCCRRQVDVPAANEWAAIVDPHDHTSAMTNANTRSERQGAVSCSHCRTIKAFSVGGTTAAQAIAAAIDASHFSTRQLDAAKQRKRGPNTKLQIAKEQSAHGATSPFRAFTRRISTTSPNGPNPHKLLSNKRQNFGRRAGAPLTIVARLLAVFVAQQKSPTCVALPTDRQSNPFDF